MRYYQPKKFNVIKANGYPERFSQKKLLQSLKRSGLPRKECQKISDKICQEVGEGANTRDIYRKVLNLVKKRSPLARVNYSLKKALFDLGPEGHHFERFVARYFEEIGYDTQTCRVIQGRYIRHEVDVIGKLNGAKFFSECKFHNKSGTKNDVKVALYVKARWDDLKHGPEGRDLDRFLLVSNTAFSLDALTYAKGTGLELLGVNAPAKMSFLETIKMMRLFPITSLRSLTRSMKKEILFKNIVLAKDLLHYKNLLLRLGLSDQEIGRVFEEINYLQSTNS